MNRKVYFLVFMLSLLIYCSGCSKSSNNLQSIKTDETFLTNQEMKADLDYLKSCILQNHPKLRNEEVRETYLEFYETFYNKINKPMSEEDFYFVIMKALAGLNDGHTSVDLYSQNYQIVDLEFLWLDEGLIISESNGVLKKGDKILAVGGMKSEKLLYYMREIISSENDNWVKFKSQQFLPTRKFLSYLGLINKNGEVEFKIERINGEKDIIIIGFEKEVNIIEEFYDFVPYFYEINENDSIGIFHLNSCIYNIDYERKVDDFFTVVNEKRINKIVIDLRKNSGGNSSVTDIFVKKLNELNKKAYVLTSKETFSSAILFGEVLRNNDLAIIVGEGTGGTEGYGNVVNFKLPNSGISFNVATRFIKIPNKGNFSEILEPDVRIKITRQDIIESKDPIMKWVLSQ